MATKDPRPAGEAGARAETVGSEVDRLSPSQKTEEIQGQTAGRGTMISLMDAWPWDAAEVFVASGWVHVGLDGAETRYTALAGLPCLCVDLLVTRDGDHIEQTYTRAREQADGETIFVRPPGSGWSLYSTEAGSATWRRPASAPPPRVVRPDDPDEGP